MADDAAAVRDEVRTFLAASWDPERPLMQWREILADSGWGCPTWPVGFCGRGLTPGLAGIVTEEFRAQDVVGVASGVGMNLAAPTILAHGSDDLKRRYLRPLVTGEHRWCQLFSEPGSGSDLAGLTTRADRDGDEWRVNGQKVWNSGAHKAAYGILLARTNWDVPKHRGITYFVIDMDQAAIEVRPLKQMNRHASFNEVFMTDARVANDDVVGEIDKGWAATMTTLAHERNIPTGRIGGRKAKGEPGRTAREAAEEAADYYKTYTWYPQRAGRADLIEPQLRANALTGDPLARQSAMGVRTLTSLAKWNLERTKAARSAGRPPGPEGSLSKLMSSRIARASALAHSALVGPIGMLDGPDTPHDGMVAEVLVSVPAMSIAGGTDEIQHNIIGERVLGLPKEPGNDADQPFREVRTN